MSCLLKEGVEISNMSTMESNSTNLQPHLSEETDVESDSNRQDVLLSEIVRALQGLQFGEVTITIRDGRVVQIDRVTRNRQILPKNP